jgi:hypothetical protein
MGCDQNLIFFDLVTRRGIARSSPASSFGFYRGTSSWQAARWDGKKSRIIARFLLWFSFNFPF